MNESHVKTLTGGDKVHARHPFGRPFSFLPSHKLILFGNHRLTINGTDDGIWRRIFLITFDRQIPVAERKPIEELVAELFTEASGILNWMIEGFRMFRVNNTLKVPDKVLEDTRGYREDSDVLGEFIEHKCELAPGFHDLLKTLWNEYETYCGRENEEKAFKTKSLFSSALQERGYEKFKTPNGNMPAFRGLKLKQPAF